MVTLEVPFMMIRPGEGLCTHFTLYVGLFFVIFFTKMAIESRWLGESFDSGMTIHGSKWWVVFKPTLYITVNRLELVKSGLPC